MPVRFNQGVIRRLIVHLNMKPLKKGSYIYGGFGNAGKWRTCKFDYHKDNDMVAAGTANSIAKSLLFKDVLEMKQYIDDNLK